MSQTHTLKRHTQHPHRSQTIPHCSLSEKNQLLWSSKAVGSRLLKKQNKSNRVSIGLWRVAAARFKQLGDISSSVRPNSVLAQTPTSCAKRSCSCLDGLQNKYAAQPKEKFLLFCSRHRVHVPGPARALFYTNEL